MTSLLLFAALAACKGTALGDARAKFDETKERAYVAVMKSDLRALADSLGTYHSQHRRYVAGTAANVDGTVTSRFPTGFTFAPTFNVTITVDTAGGSWSAAATHAVTPKACTITPGAEPVCK